MKKVVSLIATILLSTAFPGMANTLFIAGDSTAATYHKTNQQGWAALLQDYFNAEVATVDNRARGGRSTRTFISDGSWQKLIDDVNAGDVVLIQFGHNDAGKINDNRRARGTIPGIGDKHQDIVNLLTGKNERVFSFGHYLRKMVMEVKNKGATPILLSLTVRNLWRGERIERGSGSWGWWTYQIAWETDSAFIDLTNNVADKLESLGREKAATHYPKDHTHFNLQGARIHVESIVAGLKGLKRIDVKPLLSEKGKAVITDDWSWLRLPFPADKNRASVFLIGDSTVRNGAGDGSNGEWGWGDFLAQELGTQKFNVVNRAVGGLSSRTFYTMGHFHRALHMMRPGDTLLLQFGHNDSAPINDKKRARGSIPGVNEAEAHIHNQLTGEAETVHSYGWYLRRMIGEAKARGIQVAVCSPVPRKIWNANHIAQKSYSYPQWAQIVARQSNSHFIDLNTRVSAKYEQLGKRAVNKLFADQHTHTNKAGAELTAHIAAEQLQPVLGL